MNSSSLGNNPEPNRAKPDSLPAAPLLETADRFLDELSTANPRDISDQRFYQLVLDRLILISQAELAFLWIKGPESELAPAVMAKSTADRALPTSASLRTLARLLAEPPAQSGSTSVERRQTDSHTVLAARITGSQNEIRFITVHFAKSTPQPTLSVHQDLLAVVAELATEFERKRQLNDQQQLWDQLQKLVVLQNNLLSSRDLTAVSLHLVNDAKTLLRADRVWLYEPDSLPRLLACSGVAEVEPRGEAAMAMARLAQEVWRSKQSWLWARDHAVQAHATSGPHMQKWIGDPKLQALHCLLISDTPPETAGQRPSRRPHTLMIVEYHQSPDPIRSLAWSAKIIESAAAPLSQARAWRRLPFRRTLMTLGAVLPWFSWRALPGTLGLIVLALGLFASLFVIQRDFYISVNGELRPVAERHLFAPADGVVVEVLADYSDQVTADQPIFRMESSDYQLKQQQFQAQLATAQQQLEQNQLRLIQESRTSQDRFLPEKIAADIEQLKIEIQGIEQELLAYEKLQRELTITSPLAGQIISRDRRQTLLGRPVSRGNILATVSATSGPWQLICEISDRDAGYLQQALEDQSITAMALTYKRASDLDREYSLPLQRLEAHNFIKPDGTSVVRGFAAIDVDSLQSVRVGQTITGQIACGRRSLFFLWTRDLQDLMKRKFWWPGSNLR